MNKRAVRLLVTDLDNTLYDWVTFFVSAFYEMIEPACRILDVERETLLDDLREVNQRYHDSEHPFALLETRAALRRFPELDRAERAKRLDSSFEAFQAARDRELRLFPGVRETLQRLKAEGIPLIAHTESTVPNALYRLRKLGIEDCFTALYASEFLGEGHWDPNRGEELEQTNLKVHRLGLNRRKPAPEVLAGICESQGVSPAELLYVGDSLPRDIVMAKAVGCQAAWAEYGTRVDPSLWHRLVRITHWTEEDVRRASEAERKPKDAIPDIVLRESFSEVVTQVEFIGQ